MFLQTCIYARLIYSHYKPGKPFLKGAPFLSPPVPNFLSTNVRSLFPKIGEFALLLKHLCIEIAAVSETWFHHGIENDVLSIPNNNLIRRDRSVGRGGWVCAFVSNSISYKRWTDLENPLYECLWLWLRPNRLPRKISSIVIGVLYNLRVNQHKNNETH